MSAIQIAELCSVDKMVIYHKMNQTGIPRRTLGECQIAASKTGRRIIQRGEASATWKGGKYRDKKGYVHIKLQPNHPFYCMATSHEHYILEHRLVMAQELGRPLLRSEKVHHHNDIKDDNRPENLKLVSRASHLIYSELCARCPLRKEIRLLKWQVKQLNAQLQGRLIPDGDKDHG